jgi:ribosomal protein S18 acetylase RimI-like enzyme
LTTGIREAGAADRERLARSLAAAFHDDPVATWAIPPERLRRPLLTRFYRELLRQHEREQLVWCDDDLYGAAVWSAPGRTKVSIGDALNLAIRSFHPRLALRGPLLAWGGYSIERMQPSGRYFYLALLGVDPAAQGKGLGSKLLEPVLKICDDDRVGAYLESSRPENVDFYARHGFRVVGERSLPRGPLLPLMYREPV